MSAILAKMAVQISANNAEFNKAMMTSSKSLKGFGAEAQLSQTRVGQLATQISSFANPVTAAIAVVGGLTAAYAQSTIGAKDLEFAHKQLGAAITVISNEFALLFSGVEDGEGIVSKFVNSMFAMIPGLAESTFAIAKAGEALEDLARDEKLARGEVALLLGDNIEMLTTLKESQISYNDKVHEVGVMLGNINKAQDMLIGGSDELVKNGTLLTKEELKTAGVLTRQLQAKQQQLNADKENEKLLDERASIILEIRTTEKGLIRDREKVFRLESDLLDTENKRLKTLGKISQLKPSAVETTSPVASVSASGKLVASGALTGQVNSATAAIQTVSEEFKPVAQEIIDISGLVSGGIADIASSFGEAASGSVNFGQAILKSLAAFGQQFGALLIATGIAKISFDKFKGPAMVAAGIGLVTISSAVRGAISKRPNLGGSGGGSGGGSTFLRPSSAFFENGSRNSSITLEARGTSLVGVYDAQNSRNARLRPNTRRLG